MEKKSYLDPGKKHLKMQTILGISTQLKAIVDYATVHMHIKKRLRGQKSPGILFGGTYTGN